jgi:asparagine synthetase B (glutamine-hydrolysing)
MYNFFIGIGKKLLSEGTCIAANLFGANQGYLKACADVMVGVQSEAFYGAVSDEVDYFVSGKIDNLNAIALQNRLEYDKGSSIQVAALIESVGWKVVNEFKGTFAIIRINHAQNKLWYTIGNTGLMPAYSYTDKGTVVITSALKALRHSTIIPRAMIPLESYTYEYTKPVEPDFCFLQDISRVLPGFVYSFDYSSQENIVQDKQLLKPIQAASVQVTEAQAEETIYKLLTENCTDKLAAESAVGVPVSGGLDSGMIAALLHRQGKQVYTYTIGTPYGNEFSNAREVHQFISSVHKEIEMDEPGFFEGLLQSVWHNEICDPLYAEGYAGFYQVFKAAQQDTAQVFTGYGADLILGDFLNIQHKADINTFSEYWCKRAAWTGEMSPYAASALGMEVQHPFWEIDLINYSLSIPYSYKYKEQEVKAILRTLAEHKKLLPACIAGRSKNALTTGTAIDQLFSAALKIQHVKNYHFKSIFLYFLFEQFFVRDKTIHEIDTEQLIHKTKQYAG